MPTSYADRPVQGLNDAPVIDNGIASRRASMAFDGMSAELPSWFPTTEYAERTRIYSHYWKWYTGEMLAETSGNSKREKMAKFPLHINLVRGIVRKRTTVMSGETVDTSLPIVSPVIKPRPSPLPIDQLDKDLADNLENLVNEIWSENNGRTLQLENMLTSQFLGGCVFQVCWDPDGMPDARIPIRIRSIIPDFFLPIYQQDDPWNLLEAFVAYKITRAEAQLRYGIISGVNPTYIERWTKTNVEIYVNNIRVTPELKNDFGFVPFVYIPIMREGGFYGSSIIPDIEALVKEYNSRYADIGDAIRRGVNPRRFGVNISDKTIPKIPIDNETSYYDLGQTPPHNDKQKPEMTVENPSSISEGLIGHPERLWASILRESSLAPIVFGEDTGSQRSALTLAFRMWPVTAIVDIMRTYWDVGLNHISKMIIKILIAKQVYLDLPFVVPPDVLKRMTFGQRWNPKVPRDREQTIKEVALRRSAKVISLEGALEMLGDVRDVDDEIERIYAEEKRLLEMTASVGAPLGNPAQEEVPTEEIL